LTDRFEQRIESTLLSEARFQGVPQRLVAAVYFTEVGDGGGQYRWPSGKVVIGPPDGRGVFQIEPRYWGQLGTEKFTYSWSYNIKSGVTIIKDSYTRALRLFNKGSIWADSGKGETKAGEIAKGAYAIYNSGPPDWARPWNRNDHRDANFWSYYQNLVIE